MPPTNGKSDLDNYFSQMGSVFAPGSTIGGFPLGDIPQYGSGGGGGTPAGPGVGSAPPSLYPGANMRPSYNPGVEGSEFNGSMPGSNIDSNGKDVPVFSGGAEDATINLSKWLFQKYAPHMNNLFGAFTQQYMNDPKAQYDDTSRYRDVDKTFYGARNNALSNLDLGGSLRGLGLASTQANRIMAADQGAIAQRQQAYGQIANEADQRYQQYIDRLYQMLKDRAAGTSQALQMSAGTITPIGSAYASA